MPADHKLPRLVSIQSGKVATHSVGAVTGTAVPPWTSAFFKQPVKGRVQVLSEGIQGDEQADPKVHGGPDKALLAYSTEHYPSWREQLQIPDLPWGAFGENLSLEGLTEADVCLGDQWSVGEVILEVSQPRQPCWKLARRWEQPLLPKWVVATGRSGWYFRVIVEGWIEAGCPVRRLTCPHPRWTVAAANQALYEGADPKDLFELHQLPQLARAWARGLP